MQQKPKTEINYSDLEKELFLCQNKIRKYPTCYIPQLEEWSKKFKENTLHLSNEFPLRTFDGLKAVEEAITFLKSQKPLPELKYNEELSKAAREHAHDIGTNGLTGHEGSRESSLPERIEKFINWDGACAENLDFGFKNPENIILNLIVDDGSPDRSQRSNLFNANYKYVGIGCSEHRDYHYCSVFVYAKSLRSIGDPPNVGINYIQDYIQKTMNRKSGKNRFQEDDPDAPDDTISVKIIKCHKNVLGHDKKITKKIYTLSDKTQHILEIEEN